MIIIGMHFFGIAGREINTERDMIIGSTLVVIITLLSITNETGVAEWNRIIICTMIAFGIGIVIIGRLHPIGEGYLMYALDLVLVLPAYYYLQINNRKRKKAYDMIAISIVINGFISFIYCWILAVQGKLPNAARFTGHLNDPNTLSMLGVLMFIAGAYLLLNCGKMWLIAISCATIGIGVVYTVLSSSRTSILSIALCIIILAIFFIKKYIYGEKRFGVHEYWTHIIFGVVIVSAVIAIGMKIDDVNANAINKGTIDETNFEIVMVVNAADKDNDTAKEEGESKEKPNTISLRDRMDLSGGLDKFSSGRIALWQIYVENFSWFGKDVNTIRDQFRKGSAYRAHNNIIDYTFRFGYIVSFFYLLFFIMSGIAGIMVLFNKERTDSANFFLVAIIGAYSVQAMLEIATLPFTRCIPCVFFLSIAPLMGKTTKNRKGY